MNLTMSHEERQRRQADNEHRLIMFLATEGVSTAGVLSELLGYQQPQSIYKILRRLMMQKLIRARKMDYIGNLYLLTEGGMAVAEEYTEPRRVNVGDINAMTIKHRIEIQRTHIAMMNNNVRWETVFGKAKKGEQKPDGVIWFHYDKEQESEIAIEVELTVKTKKRYSQIYQTYCRMKYATVIYVVPDEAMKNRLSRIFDDIKKNDPRIDGVGTKKIKIQCFTAERFASVFSHEYSQQRLAEIRQR